MVSSIGTQMNNVAKVWLLYQLTRSAAALGFEGLCFSIPIAVLPLVGGPIVDRLDRLAVVKAALLVEAGESAALTAVAACGGVRPWMLYLAAAVAATRLSVAIPAGAAAVPALVSESALQSGVSLSAMVWSSSALIGPALAGLLLTVSPATTVFAVNGVLTLVAWLAVRPVTRGSTQAATQVSVTKPAEGLRFLRHRRQLPALQALVFLTSALLIGTETLLPVLDVQVWDGGTLGYGLLRVAPGLAAVAAGIALSLRRPSSKPFAVIGMGFVVACPALAGFVRSPWLTTGFALLATASFALVATQILAVTLLQQNTPDRLRGAVGGVTTIAQSGLAGIAAAGLALAASVLGAPAALGVTAALALPLGLAGAVYAGRRRSAAVR